MQATRVLSVAEQLGDPREWGERGERPSRFAACAFAVHAELVESAAS